MVLDNRRRKESKLTPKTELPKKTNGSRLGTVVLLLGTIFLSCFFWGKSQFSTWWQELSKPFIYQIGGKRIERKQEKDFAKLEKSIELLIGDLQGKYGIYFYDLEKEQSLGINQDKVFTAASVNKIPIMVSFYQQVEKDKIEEDGEYVLKKEDLQDYGAGSMRYQEPGTKYKYFDLVELIGKESDNTAAYIITNLLGSATQESLDNLEMENTSIEENKTTAKEMGDYLTGLYRNELVTKKYKEKILKFLTKTDFEERIPRGVPENVQVAHKTGNEIQVYNDCGIVLSKNPYVLCVLSQEAVKDEALEVIPEISELIWKFVD